MIRRATGLVLDPYFSATKLAWLLEDGGIERDSGFLFGTVDTWILWNLTGGVDGGVHATDPSNASRTMLYDIGARAWSDDLAALFGVPMSCLPVVAPSSGRFGMTRADRAGGLVVPVSGIAGDQQAALFGQACVEPGMTKNTYGTGSFVLTNIGSKLPEPVDGLLTTVAWSLGANDDVTYAMEGAIFVTGAAVQWLRDGLGLISEAAETGPLAASVPDSGGVYVVPAFTGLGSPWWDAYARGTIVGITARNEPRAPGPRGRRVDGVPDRRRRGRDQRGERHDTGRDARRRRRVGDGSAPAVPGRPHRRARPARGRTGDDRARRRVPRRFGGRRVGFAGHGQRDLAGRRVVLPRDGRRRPRRAPGHVAPRRRAFTRLGARVSEAGPPLLVVSGPVGVGKTTTGYQVSTLLGDRGIPNTFVDIDALSETWPARADDRFNQQLARTNLGDVWRNAAAVGSRNLIVAAVIEHRSECDALAAELLALVDWAT